MKRNSQSRLWSVPHAGRGKAGKSCQNAPGRRPALHCQSGVALVITLILLSVITFMAVTFLVISRRGSEQVDTTTQQTLSRMAADNALEQVKSRIISDMMARDNGFDFPLVVSTNHESPFFVPGLSNIANVSYYDSNGIPLTGFNLQQMLANQMVLPGPPVFIVTNKALPNLPEHRFYLDLNRNGVFDPTGLIVEVDNSGQPIRDANNNMITNFHVGDPQWIGILEHPDQPHSSSNRYIARYCFIAVPIGNGLDINASHNHAKAALPSTVDGFLRNEGVGTWEINLAGFLNALNPNYWIYGNGVFGLGYAGFDTNTPPVGTYFSSPGTAFVDANSILQYRYSGGFYSLNNTFLNLFGPNAAARFAQDGNDGYTVGPLMTSFQPPAPADPDAGYVSTAPWSGADNPNHFYTTQDPFNLLSGPNTFAARLQAAGLNVDTFDRYTYYRMLAQMGTDSAPEDTNKINLNYINLDGIAASNYIPWDALTNGMINGTPVTNLFPGATITDGGLAFFMNAADRLLKSQPDFVNLSITNIPVYPVNYYTPAVHRLLQLAANIYDSTTVHPFDTNTFAFDQLSYPSVFQPTFTNFVFNGVTNIIINGYTTNLLFTHPVDAAVVAAAGTNAVNIYGVPWVIGARKGLPNLNKLVMQSTFSLTRKLQIVKNAGNPTEHSLYHTNVQYGLSITNTVGVQAWNSYTRPYYPRAVNIVCYDEVGVALTNQSGVLLAPPTYINSFSPVIPANTWAGFSANPNSAPASAIARSFDVAIDATNAVLPGAVFHPNGTFTLTSNVNSVPFDTTTGYPQPTFGLNVTNHVWFYMLDAATGRVIDYVQLNGMTSQQTLMDELKGNDNYGPGGVWDTNRMDGTSNNNVAIWGIENQIQASMQNPPYNSGNAQDSSPLTATDWAKAGLPAGFSSVNQAVTAFKGFYNGGIGDPGGLVMQAPYTPTRSVSVFYTWQANDPLVHYMLSDLSGLGDFNTQPQTNYDNTVTALVQTNLSQMSARYLPWGGAGNGKADAYGAYIYNLALMDPQITRSDDWQFPTNKFPNIGWLGRVHRGTPWQTVYMKSPPVDHDQWQNWTGNPFTRYPGFFVNDYDDSADAQPINDRAIFDLFTTAPNDNATRGQLSINQTNSAAWAAVLDGAIAITNDPANPGSYGPLVIDPSSTSLSTGANALQQIVTDLNLSKTNYLGNVWVRLGDMLSTPSLTVNSPFLNTNGMAASDVPNDFAYERIPQQIMSLLRVGSPRYVVYAYGQSLKPAANSLVTSGPFFQLCTNYQITGEVATRTVLRFEPSAALKSFSPSTPFNPTRNPAMVGQKFGGGNGQPNPRAVVESFTVLPPE